MLAFLLLLQNKNKYKERERLLIHKYKHSFVLIIAYYHCVAFILQVLAESRDPVLDLKLIDMLAEQQSAGTDTTKTTEDKNS